MYGDQPPGAPGHYGDPNTTVPKNGLGIAAVILAILGALTFLVPVLGLLLGLVGLVLGLVALRRVRAGRATNRGVALAAIIVGVLATVAGLVVTVFVVWFTWFAVDNSEEFRACTQAATTQAQIDACGEQFGNDLLDRLGVETS